MTRLLHISDTHFGTEDETVVRALLSFARSVAPELVVLSGDITQRARRSQFARAGAFARRLPAPVLAVPGNHDIPLFDLLRRWWSPYGRYRRVFGVELQPVFESAELLVIGVNSTRPARHKDGEVSARQIDAVSERLRAAGAGQLRVVVLHHPMRAWLPSDRPNVLHGSREAARAWAEAGADLVLGGHIHLPYVLPLVEEQACGAWLVQAGTAVSRRVRGDIPNSVNLIEYDAAPAPACAVERWDFAARDGVFRRYSRTALPLSRSS